MNDMNEGLDGPELDYSQVADEQLDEMESTNPALYDRVLDICEAIADDPGGWQARASALQTKEGIRFRVGVPGTQTSVFWSLTNGVPRIEAVFRWRPTAR